MKRNIGRTDRMVRIALALLFGGLYFTGTVIGTWGLVLLAFAAIFLLTSFLSFCPVYYAFGANTCEKKS